MTEAHLETVVVLLERIAVALEQIAQGVDQIGETLAVELGDISLIALKSGSGPVELSRPSES